MRAPAIDRTDLRGPLLGAAVLAALFTWMFWDFLSTQVRWAVRMQADWGHTLVIPLIAGYFVYLGRDRLLARPFRTTWLGLVPVVAGVGFYILCSVGPPAVRHHNLQGFGAWVTFTGLVLLFCGWRATWIMLFPLLYLLVFGQTVSERFMKIVTFRLQDVTARGSWFVLRLLGYEVDLEGNTLYLFDDGVTKPLNIAEACSGMRMLMGFLALGVAMAYTGLRRQWQRILLVVLTIPTSIFVNILRVVTLSLLALVDTDFAAGDFHSFIGLVWLVPAFVIYLGLLWIIRRLVTEAPAGDAPAAGGTGGV
ncbi:MAG: exosortase/archaeosortase family protein [Planctomycetota bacterium]